MLVEMFYIYGLYDSREDSSKIVYVGRTKNPSKRLYRHNFCRINGRMPKGLLAVNMQILDSTTRKDACAELERHWIARLLADGHPLMNCNHRKHVCTPLCPAFSGGRRKAKSMLKASAKTRCIALNEKDGQRCQRSSLDHELCCRHRKMPSVLTTRNSNPWSRARWKNQHNSP